jgi:hypothetical protein
MLIELNWPAGTDCWSRPLHVTGRSFSAHAPGGEGHAFAAEHFSIDPFEVETAATNTHSHLARAMPFIE